ncbi:hypothetical protein JTE90_000924 [Oedothorax gibbosus]|uniref:Uncharacterized protein n=1 Tax=Oedothorax gibbosus TaxID=931172 RepID=A0AAV6TFM7_9ARAC|nr:hypothetical protein JTE90_000924 [Oedothorax gibbosus]
MEENSCLSTKVCFIHICDESNEHLKLMSAKNFAKISSCMKLWLTLDGKEKDIATDLSNLPGTAMDQNPLKQTANPDSKTKGGLIGFTRNFGWVCTVGCFPITCGPKLVFLVRTCQQTFTSRQEKRPFSISKLDA